MTMPSPRVRLAVAAALFLGWLGWLGYLAATGTDPVVLSRPQFLVSNLYVVADLEGETDAPHQTVLVREAGGPLPARERPRPGDGLTIANLPQVDRAQGWQGRGRYILPLTRSNGRTLLTRTPPSPGYPATGHDPLNRLRIYPVTSSTLRQLQQIEQQGP
jgi:hypothetical protein